MISGKSTKKVLLKSGRIIDPFLKKTFNGDVLIENGKIIEVGEEISTNEKNLKIIDGNGMHLTPGIIDEHSHIALFGVNEGSQSNTAEVRRKM